MQVISIYPNGMLKKDLERMAKKDNRSLNNFILSILTKYARSHRK